MRPSFGGTGDSTEPAGRTGPIGRVATGTADAVSSDGMARRSGVPASAVTLGAAKGSGPFEVRGIDTGCSGSTQDLIRYPETVMTATTAATAPTRRPVQHPTPRAGSTRPEPGFPRGGGGYGRRPCGLVGEQCPHRVREERLQRRVVRLIDIGNTEDTYLVGLRWPPVADMRRLLLLHHADHIGPIDVSSRDLVSARVSLRTGGTHIVVALALYIPRENAEDVLRGAAATEVMAADE